MGGSAKMHRLLLAGLMLCSVPLGANALELKNIRPSYGPLGAARSDVKCVPGDSLFMTYDIEGLRIHDKTGRANYTTKLELYDTTGQVAFQKDTPNDVALPLGGTRMPGDLIVFLGSNQKPGKHKIRLAVTDHLAKETKSFEYPFDVIAPEFSFVGVSAKTVGFPSENYATTFAIVNMTLDAKKQPSVDIAMRVYDESGKKPVAPQILSSLPKDLPDEIDLKKENFVPMQFPIYLNRAGRFVVEVLAYDKATKKTIQLRYPLTVLDTATFR
jgi:hypothetical protein